MLSLFIVLSIVVCIATGWKTKINIGMLAIVFAYIFGCFALDMTPKAVTQLWPTTTFFIILMLAYFYSFAAINGTLEKMAVGILYLFRRRPALLPFCIYLTALLMAAPGPGYYTVMAFFPALAVMLSKKSGVSVLVCLLSAHLGSLSGSSFMTSNGGVIMRDLMTTSGYTGQEAFSMTAFICVVNILVPLLVIGTLMIFGKNNINRESLLDLKPPAALNKKQKTNVLLIFIMLALALIPPILNQLLPDHAGIAFVNSKIDMGLICACLAVVAMFLDLGDKKAAFARIPWNTLMMVAGVGMLIGVATQAGMLELLGNWMGSNIPAWTVPMALCAVAGLMSFFSSGYGVTAPALFPLVPALSAATGISPYILFACALMGLLYSSGSPFSSGGSLMLAAADETDRDYLFSRLLSVGAGYVLLFGIAASLVLYLIF